MLSRFVRIQLVIFTIASIVGIVVMVFSYIQAPTLLGIGRITVKLELAASGGLYRFSNVTYRGVKVGKVTEMDVSRTSATATLSLDTSPKIPADLRAEVRSVSAVGEQYVELLPRTDSGPYLRDGSVIPMRDTKIPQQVGPMLDEVSTLLDSIPQDKLSGLIDESFKAFNGSGYDLGSLFDSSATIAGDLNGVADQTTALVQDSGPFLDSQVQSTDALRLWTRGLAGITEQVVTNDPQVRTLLQRGPDAANEVSRLLTQVKPTLPVLLANMTTFGQIAVTYHSSLEQLLVLLPPLVGYIQSSTPSNNPTGIPMGDFRVSIADPPSCTVGFLPPSQWRSPADTTTIDTPDGLYCKLPQDSPIAVRAARNYPCMGVPGKRAPTVQECDSDKPFEPLAMRQHALGPYPIDPNLIAQGVPPDSRADVGDRIFAPVEGTPMPPGAPIPPPPDGAPLPAEPPAPPLEPPSGAAAGGDAPPAAPNAFTTEGSGSGPSVAIAHYDPQTGEYATPAGQVFRQTDLVAPSRTWRDLIYKAGQ
jgi:phospholipid/cholesterol/gamma-HCH transport system substrate-binding protein